MYSAYYKHYAQTREAILSPARRRIIVTPCVCLPREEISFKYPIIWGEPKVLKEGDIHYVNEYDKSNVLVSKGRFIINFPKSHPSVEIEGFNNDFTTGDSIEDKFSEYIYCALYNLKNKDYEVGKKLKSGSTLVYSANRREAENRIGLFGDIILNYSKGKYPSICATMSLGNDRNFLEKVFSEQKSTYNQKPFFDLILTSDYLKGLNTATKEAVENFEKFAELLKTIN